MGRGCPGHTCPEVIQVEGELGPSTIPSSSEPRRLTGQASHGAGGPEAASPGPVSWSVGSHTQRVFPFKMERSEQMHSQGKQACGRERDCV